MVEAAAAADVSIRYLGLVPSDQVTALYDATALVVVPSLWPEPDPLVAIGAFAAGRPVLACRLGAMARYIDDDCGWLAEPSTEGLSTALKIVIAGRDEMDRRAQGARKQFEALRSPAARLGLRSVYESLASVPRGSIVVVGPDGAGKSTLVDSLATTAANAHVDVVRSHFKPGVLLHSHADGGPVDDPHSQPARGALLAASRTVLVWLDFVAGWLAPWRRAQQRGLLLQERPWLDQAVDPRRYRLPPASAKLVRALGRLLPRADVCIELRGDPDAIHDRKPEIGVTEVARQQRNWHELAPAMGKRIIEIDAVGLSIEQVISSSGSEIRPPTTVNLHGWTAAWGYPSRIGLRVSSEIRPRAALAIYPPQKRSAITRASHRTDSGVALGLGVPANEPPVPIREILMPCTFAANGIVAMRSSRGGRWIVGHRAGRHAAGGGEVRRTAAMSDCETRRRRSACCPALDCEFRVPELIFAGEIDDSSVRCRQVGCATDEPRPDNIDRASADRDHPDSRPRPDRADGTRRFRRVEHHRLQRQRHADRLGEVACWSVAIVGSQPLRSPARRSGANVTTTEVVTNADSPHSPGARTWRQCRRARRGGGRLSTATTCVAPHVTMPALRSARSWRKSIA